MPLLLVLLLLPFVAVAQSHSANMDSDQLIAGPEADTSGSAIHPKLFSGVYPDKDERYDVTFYGLNLEIFPDSQRIAGAVTIGYTLQEATDELQFDLTSSLKIDSLISASGAKLDYQRDAQNDFLVNAALGGQLPAGTQSSITVYYQGEPGDDGFGSFTFAEVADEPVIWTLSEPFGAKQWFPCKDTPADKADSAHINITVPKPLFAASNGVLTDSVSLPGNRTRYEWKTRYPIAQYLISLAIADYQYYEQTFHMEDGSTMPVTNYIYETRDMEQFQSRTAVTIELLELFSELFGPYPFHEEKYGHAEFTWGGGMEHQTLSSMGGFSLRLVSHELAHQWFGDAVTCQTWQDIWLNEGFATYAEGLAVEHLNGQKAFAGWIQGLYGQITSRPYGSVYVPEEEVVANSSSSVSRIFSSRLSYAKGGAVLHMLRELMGDEAFFNASRKFVQDDFKFKTATTEDLEKNYEREYGASLDFFFDQWVYGEGHPEYYFRYNTLAKLDSSQIFIEIEDEPTHPSVDHFRMPVPIHIYNENNDTTITVWHDKRKQQWKFDLPFQPKSILFDTANTILRDRVYYQQVSDSVWNQELPEKTKLLANYPNPFNNVTNLQFELEERGEIRLDIYNLYGQHIRTLYQGEKPAGLHQFRWNANGLSSGIYYFYLVVDGRTYTKKATLTK